MASSKFTQAELNSNLMDLLQRLFVKVPESLPFHRLVDSGAVPTYKNIIKNPIDLGTIQTKVEGNEYDVRLMLSNAFLFNKRNTVVYDYALKVSKITFLV